MFRVTENVAWTEENVDDIVLGSGATAYEWWLDLTQVGDIYFLTGENPEGDEDDDAPVSVSFTRDEFVTACQDCLDGKWIAYMTGSGETVADYIRKDDLDADAVDCIFQMLVYKELVYG